MHDLLLTVLSHLCSLSVGISILHVIKLNWALETETMVMLYLQARSYIDIGIESFWGLLFATRKSRQGSEYASCTRNPEMISCCVIQKWYES
jgi:hypothetical protein